MIPTWKSYPQLRQKALGGGFVSSRFGDMTYYSVSHRDHETEYFERHLIEALPAHIGRFIDGEPLVFHETDSDHMHLDVFMWAPTTQRPRWTMVTSGLSARPMAVPAGAEHFARAELVMTLPEDCPSLSEIQRMPDSRAKRFEWPMRNMKNLARMTYLYDTWLSYGHSTRARRAIHQTYPRSQFSGMLIEAVQSMPQEASTFDVDDHTVHCLGLYLLDPTELEFMLAAAHGGPHDMLHRLNDAGYHEGVFPGREAVV